MTLGVSALCYLLWVKQGYKRITGGVLNGLIQSPNRTVIQCLTDACGIVVHSPLLVFLRACVVILF
jgi:hypothetical protein